MSDTDSSSDTPSRATTHPYYQLDIGRDKILSQDTFAGLNATELAWDDMVVKDNTRAEIIIRLNSQDRPKKFYQEIYATLDYLFFDELNDDIAPSKSSLYNSCGVIFMEEFSFQGDCLPP
jgi:hypothetical protein